MLLSDTAKKKGIFDLYTLAIIGGLIIAVVLFVLVFAFVSNLISVKSIVKLTVDVDDKGSRLNSFLSSERGGVTYLEILGNTRAGSPPEKEVEETLEALDWSLIVEDETQEPLYTIGDVRRDAGVFVQIPLPGLKKGRIGIDTR